MLLYSLYQSPIKHKKMKQLRNITLIPGKGVRATRKAAIIAELKTRRTNMQESTPFSRIQSLLFFLSRHNPLYGNDGIKCVPTIRAYFLKYDRAEYRSILQSIHRQNAASQVFDTNRNDVNRVTFYPKMSNDAKLYSTLQIDTNLIWQQVK